MKNLKAELVGIELTLLELDNKMVERGYYTIFDEGVLEEVLVGKSSAFLSTKDNETQILVSFEVLSLADAEVESLGASYLKITDIENL